MDRFERFRNYLLGHPEACQVAARLVRDGVSFPQVFKALVVYAEGWSIAEGRKKRGQADRAIVNRGVRENGVSPELGRWLIARAELAHATNGLGRVHNTDSLIWLHTYLEVVTGRRITMSELAYLIEAGNHALGRRPVDVDPKSVEAELRRHRSQKENALFLKLIREDISKNLENLRSKTSH